MIGMMAGRSSSLHIGMAGILVTSMGSSAHKPKQHNQIKPVLLHHTFVDALGKH